VDLGAAPRGSGKAVVKGRADAIVTARDGARYGVEIKTSRSDLSLPMEHHLDQVRIYNLLFNLERSYLLYVTPERIAQYEVSERASVEEVARRILEAKSPRYPWECRYCPFAVLCPSKLAR
jgi:CRISPR-associated exonuclease Cas4